MRRRILVATAVLGLSTLTVATAWASHVRIELAPQAGHSSTTVIVPSPGAPSQTPQSLNVDQITANVVRADTIYANRIEADEMRGQIYQTKEVKIGDTRGELRAPEVAAAVIYADEITANAVVAQHIYVRDLRRQ